MSWPGPQWHVEQPAVTAIVIPPGATRRTNYDERIRLHDHLLRPDAPARLGPYAHALALALAVPALWLFAITVVFGRGVTGSPGGGFWLPLTGALHSLLA